VRCAACGADESSVHVAKPVDREYFVVRKAKAHIDRCKRCQSLTQVPWPSIEETNTFYHENYQNYTKAASPVLGALFEYMHVRAATAFAAEFGKDSVVLDFGCNQGMFLRHLYNVGYRNLVGFDVVSPKDAHDGVFIFSDSLENLKRSGRKFDVIRLNHVIEHLSALDETMKTLASLLSDRGCIIGQTPNGAHYTSFLSRSFWGPLHYPYHVVLFSQAGLSLACRRWGLESNGFAPTIQPTGWSMTFENLLKRFFWPKRQGRSPIYSFLLLASLPFVAADRILAALFSTPIVNFKFKPTK
jgi:2-polyprenyl-3-methyl-5-hydroxy-6-metoxy-1,4-benzoquinol methylase